MSDFYGLSKYLNLIASAESQRKFTPTCVFRPKRADLSDFCGLSKELNFIVSADSQRKFTPKHVFRPKQADLSLLTSKIKIGLYIFHNLMINFSSLHGLYSLKILRFLTILSSSVGKVLATCQHFVKGPGSNPTEDKAENLLSCQQCGHDHVRTVEVWDMVMSALLKRGTWSCPHC